LDTVELARFLMPMQGSYRLGELADDLEIEHERPHQADSDALATAQLFLHLLENLQQLPLVTLQRLQMLVSSQRTDISVLLRHIEMEKMLQGPFEPGDGQEKPPEEEMWDIYRQLALRKRVAEKIEPTLGQYVQRLQFADELDEIIGEQASLAQAVDGYQRRESQEEMIQAIYDAMNDGAHLLVEAGTGTGKSLAYLLPSIYWSKRHQEQVVISTHTI
ncbi:hypothetical protein MXD63_37185, partial [Frankia sp. Cpl3]|nr:hypothetical protein [Frankia sp. Cpl3]